MPDYPKLLLTAIVWIANLAIILQRWQQGKLRLPWLSFFLGYTLITLGLVIVHLENEFSTITDVLLISGGLLIATGTGFALARFVWRSFRSVNHH